MFTQYSATSTVTVTDVVTAPTQGIEPTMKRRSHNKRGCRPRSSSTAAPSTPIPTATPSSTSASYPIASNCPSLEEYSSACGCIAGASTITADPAISTEIVTVTESTPVPSTSTSVVTVIVTSTAVEPGSQTITVTVPGGVWQTTTTVTSTSTPAPPIQTAYLVLESSAVTGKYLKATNGYLQFETTPEANHQKFLLTTAGGQPVLTNNPSIKLYLPTLNPIAVLYFETEIQARRNNDTPVTCEVSADGYLVCTTPTRTVMLRCGAYLYLATPEAAAAECTPAKFKVSV